MTNDVTVSFGVELSRLSEGLRAASAQVAEAADAMRASLAASHQQLYAQLTAADEDFHAKTRRNNDKSVSEMDTSWRRLGNNIRNSFSNALSGMILGTTNFERALQQISASILRQFVNLGVRMATNWLATELGMTAATEAGTSQRLAAEEAGSIGSVAISATKAVRAIGNYALETFAGVFAFLSDLMGPAAAGPAAASEATVAAVAGSIAFAERGFDVSADTLAFLHKDEMVLPASLASGLRGMTRDGLGASAPVINISYAAQGRVSASEILDHSQTIARAVARELRHFNQSLRPR